MNSLRGKKNAGFTLVELAIVLTVVGIIIAAIYVVFSHINSERRITDTKRQISQIYENVKDYMSGQNINYLQSANGALVAQGTAAFTLRMFNAGIFQGVVDCGDPPASTTCRTPYGTAYELQTTSDAPTQKLVFNLRIDSLPQDACINLVPYFAGNGNSDVIGIARVSSTNGDSSIAHTAAPITPSQATSDFCTTALNNISFRFRL